MTRLNRYFMHRPHGSFLNEQALRFSIHLKNRAIIYSGILQPYTPISNPLFAQETPEASQWYRCKYACRQGTGIPQLEHWIWGEERNTHLVILYNTNTVMIWILETHYTILYHTLINFLLLTQGRKAFCLTHPQYQCHMGTKYGLQCYRKLPPLSIFHIKILHLMATCSHNLAIAD